MMAELSGTTVMARGVPWRTLTMLAITLGGVVALSACGGDDEAPAAAANPAPGVVNPPAGGGNRAPTLTGAPQTTVMQSQPYNFAPTANDADGNPLTFTIANRPTWAAFDAVTGVLSGQPGAGDVGTYANIQITVSDGTATASTSTFSIQVVATATGSALLTWTPPQLNTDGSALINLSGYKVYWGSAAGNYTNSVSVGVGLASYTVALLTPGTWFFTVTALNGQGVESAFSNVAQKTL